MLLRVVEIRFQLADIVAAYVLAVSLLRALSCRRRPAVSDMQFQ